MFKTRLNNENISIRLLILYCLYQPTVWLSGNGTGHIIEVRSMSSWVSRLLRWVTICRHTIWVFNQPSRPTRPDHLSVDRQNEYSNVFYFFCAICNTKLSCLSVFIDYNLGEKSSLLLKMSSLSTLCPVFLVLVQFLLHKHKTLFCIQITDRSYFFTSLHTVSLLHLRKLPAADQNHLCLDLMTMNHRLEHKN